LLRGRQRGVQVRQPGHIQRQLPHLGQRRGGVL